MNPCACNLYFTRSIENKNSLNFNFKVECCRPKYHGLDPLRHAFYSSKLFHIWCNCLEFSYLEVGNNLEVLGFAWKKGIWFKDRPVWLSSIIGSRRFIETTVGNKILTYHYEKRKKTQSIFPQNDKIIFRWKEKRDKLFSLVKIGNEVTE